MRVKAGKISEENKIAQGEEIYWLYFSEETIGEMPRGYKFFENKIRISDIEYLNLLLFKRSKGGGGYTVGNINGKAIYTASATGGEKDWWLEIKEKGREPKYYRLFRHKRRKIMRWAKRENVKIKGR